MRTVLVQLRDYYLRGVVVHAWNNTLQWFGWRLRRSIVWPVAYAVGFFALVLYKGRGFAVDEMVSMLWSC